MIDMDMIKQELNRLLDEAYDAHSRNEYFAGVSRLTVIEGKPDWKIIVVWEVSTNHPSVVIKQRTI